MSRLSGVLVGLARLNLIMAVGMAALTWVVQVLAGLPAQPLAPLLVSLAVFSIYSLDRVTDSSADVRTHPERAGFSARHARWLRAAAVAAYALAVGLAWSRGPAAVACALLPLAALLLYSFPLLPREVARRVGFSRLKELFLVKNLVVAATLASTATLMPVAVSGAPPRPWALLAVWAFLSGRLFINVVAFDLRDEQGDRVNGVRTLPVVLGPRRTLRWLHGVNGALLLLALGGPVLGVARGHFAALGVSCLYTWLYLRALPGARDVHFLCDVVVDGELTALAGAVLAALWLLPS
jgi:4-hydroxybenzoate polyprenyltransferase